jgi:hypothetical protein
MSNHTNVDTVTLPIIPRDGRVPLVIRVVVPHAGGAPHVAGAVPSMVNTQCADYVHFQALPRELQERIKTYVQAVQIP